jgi:exodeoxyribonuclease V alpha subunit
MMWFKRSRTRNDDKSIVPNPDLIDIRTYVVDEASMVDVATLYQILRRIGPGGRLILVGDDLQLPPIGAGLTFHLLCRESAPAQRVHLTQVYRQEGTTGIPAISQAIREGRWPEIPAYGGPGIGVSILTCSESEAADVISGIYDDLVRAEEGGEEEVQILATTKGEKRETPFSVTGINKDL